jgi:hypothetical protein
MTHFRAASQSHPEHGEPGASRARLRDTEVFELVRRDGFPPPVAESSAPARAEPRLTSQRTNGEAVAAAGARAGAPRLVRSCSRLGDDRMPGNDYGGIRGRRRDSIPGHSTHPSSSLRRHRHRAGRDRGRRGRLRSGHDVDRRPRWETRGDGGHIDQIRPARIASSRQRRVRTSSTVPLRAPRRRARLTPRPTRALPLSPTSSSPPSPLPMRSRRPTPHHRITRDTRASSPTPRERPLGTRGSSAPISIHRPGGRLLHSRNATASRRRNGHSVRSQEYAATSRARGERSPRGCS